MTIKYLSLKDRWILLSAEFMTYDSYRAITAEMKELNRTRSDLQYTKSELRNRNTGFFNTKPLKAWDERDRLEVQHLSKEIAVLDEKLHELQKKYYEEKAKLIPDYFPEFGHLDIEYLESRLEPNLPYTALW